jgi:RNA polymerase sigma factor (TIGR02999 family)
LPVPGDITLLLQRANAGDVDAADQLFRRVEADLRAIAGKRRRNFPGGLDASTTLLIDEAFCRLLGGSAEAASLADRQAFFRFAATKIHNLLVELARAERAQKRGGGWKRVDAEPADPRARPADDLDLLVDLQEALARFEAFAPQDASVFRVRYFLDCTFEETAEVLGVSASEAKRGFARAKLWLQQQLRGYADDA